MHHRVTGRGILLEKGTLAAEEGIPVAEEGILPHPLGVQEGILGPSGIKDSQLLFCPSIFTAKC